MTLFLIVGGLLLVTVLGLLLIPLLRRHPGSQPAASSTDLSLGVLREQLAELDQARSGGLIAPAAFQQERTELERRTLEEASLAQRPTAYARRPWLAGSLALSISLAAGGLYWQLGSPAVMRNDPPRGSHALDPRQIEAMAMKLAERLQHSPQDGQGWLMLARSYVMLRRYAESAAAYGRAASLLPPDAGLLADYADALAMAQGRRLAGEPEKIVARALEADPNHVKALALRGSADFERQQFESAITCWEKVLTLVPSDSGIAQGMRNSIADARRRLGGGTVGLSAPVMPGGKSVQLPIAQRVQ